jgi:hypothetical protein
MALHNGFGHANGKTRETNKTTARIPRRIVLLMNGEQSAVSEILVEPNGHAITGNRMHAEIQIQAAAHPGKTVAAEWLGSLGWTRFLWCTK